VNEKLIINNKTMKKNVFIIAITLLVIIKIPGYSIEQFPFNNENNNSSILAYWYNCKSDSVTIPALNATGYFNSSLQVYGPMVADSFQVKVEVFLPDSVLAYTNTFTIKKNSPIKDANHEVVIIDNFFRIMSSV